MSVGYLCWLLLLTLVGLFDLVLGIYLCWLDGFWVVWLDVFGFGLIAL